MRNFKELGRLAGLSPVDLSDGLGYDSANLLREMTLLEDVARSRIEAGLSWVKNAGLHAVILGGTAVVYYVSGARPLTPDVDLLVSDYGSLKARLAEDRLEVTPLGAHVNPRWGGSSIGLHVPQFDADFLDAHAGNLSMNGYVMRTAKTGRIGGVAFPIISPEALTIMKFDTGRERDGNDAFLLLKSGKLNREVYLEALRELKGKVADVKSLKMYAAMIP